MYKLLDEFFDLFSAELENTLKTNNIPKNVTENEGSYTVVYDIPGFEREEIDIEIVDSPSKPFTSQAHIGLLRVSAKNKERSVKKAWYLTGNIDQNNIEASLKNGVLTITLPKQETKPKSTKKITIK
jgi:HSP20 family protein